MGNFQIHFIQLRMTFFIKLWWQKKIIFIQMHRTILLGVISMKNYENAHC